jgi:hypothetical protein
LAVLSGVGAVEHPAAIRKAAPRTAVSGSILDAADNLMKNMAIDLLDDSL